MRLLKFIAFGGAALLMTAMPLFADGFKFYDFECESMGIVRTRDQLVYSGRDPNIGEDIVYACEGMSCFHRSNWNDGKGTTGTRVRHIYFPLGRMEMVFSTASWRDGEDVPYDMNTEVVPLLTCGF